MIKNDIRSKYNSILKQLNKHNKYYYEQSKSYDDSEYDKLKLEV